MAYHIVPAHLAVKAMQDNGYKNAAYAIAELIDNSIQANATMVELLCMEEVEKVSQRVRSRIRELAVLDNGDGMTADELRVALQFGNGSYLEDRSGIGRFGMGLPCSSISQAQRLDVWTWQAGVKSAIHSYLDVDEIGDEKYSEVPASEKRQIPKHWLDAGQSFGKSGTLVVWTRMERCIWRTSGAIIENSEFLIGRIYRKFIASKKVKIRMASFNMGSGEVQIDKLALPNDPLYLTKNSSCPAPFNKEPMFESWGEQTFTVSHDGKKHSVTVRFSIASKAARSVENAGNSKHGQHAARNIGLSIIRADRELDLDQDWTIKYDPRERWWGAELDFPPALDELFGVTNNKQAAHNFSLLARENIEDLLAREKMNSVHELMQVWEESGDPRAPLLELASHIQKSIKSLRDLIRDAQIGVRSRKRHANTLVEEQATEATKQRQSEGFKGLSDKQEGMPPAQRIEELARDLKNDGKDATEAKEQASLIIDRGLKYEIVQAEVETPAFFSVKSVAGVLKVTLNTSHPAYDNLVEVLEEEVEGVDAGMLRQRLLNARDGLKLVLTAWARYEDEQPDGDRRHRAQEARTDWGRVARSFFKAVE